MHFLKNERGLTLIELLAAVVVLGVLVAPFLSLGMTAYRWQAEDEQLNQAVLLAEQNMQEAKQSLSESWDYLEEEGDDEESGLHWKITSEEVSLDGSRASGLMRVTVTIFGQDLAAYREEDPYVQKQITELSTIVRQRESQP